MEIKAIFLVVIAVVVLALIIWGLLVKGVGVGDQNPAVKIIIDWVHKLFSSNSNIG
jgi:uncharacterized protein YxeA